LVRAAAGDVAVHSIVAGVDRLGRKTRGSGEEEEEAKTHK
jgi:hypothetical protein